MDVGPAARVNSNEAKRNITVAIAIAVAILLLSSIVFTSLKIKNISKMRKTLHGIKNIIKNSQKSNTSCTRQETKEKIILHTINATATSAAAKRTATATLGNSNDVSVFRQKKKEKNQFQKTF